MIIAIFRGPAKWQSPVWVTFFDANGHNSGSACQIWVPFLDLDSKLHSASFMLVNFPSNSATFSPISGKTGILSQFSGLIFGHF